MPKSTALAMIEWSRPSPGTIEAESLSRVGVPQRDCSIIVLLSRTGDCEAPICPAESYQSYQVLGWGRETRSPARSDHRVDVVCMVGKKAEEVPR